ncbi:F-box/kelch-repeat protein-like [Dorcoceras hygrometricum]|uniref:F-box/kelch-repeat protein-like n=1 Tax=Dorcoceras hygrometricum TaxID=472368 RepID=A0A2Z7D7A8_9LAMI|nr:F-box/kelch-repeat protein-like [Dorcoceras hygrometricum]
MATSSNHHMKNSPQLTDLPLEIITNILSRLAILNIVRLKCVCKPWLELLDSPEFTKLHLSRSSPGLLVHQQHSWESSFFSYFGFKDVREVGYDRHELLNFIPESKSHTNIFCGRPKIVGSVDGFLCLRSRRPIDSLYICNPITHAYISLPTLERAFRHPFTVAYGFGVSITDGQYKVVLTFQESKSDPTCRRLTDSHVYTLGTTGKWRCITSSTQLDYACFSIGASLNGNLHWLAGDLHDSRVISCLDLDKELFTTFSAPSLPGYRSKCLASLVVLGDCLSVCDNTSETDIVIWMMEDYGVEESWTRGFVISKIPNPAGACFDVVSPIKLFENGDILMTWGDYDLHYYSNMDKTLSRMDILELENCWAIEAILHVPALVSLTCFARESVHSF